jgi:hypothetical protein
MSRTKKKSAQGPSHRDMAQRMLIERKGAGAGKHHTRDRDVLKGTRRKGKHEMNYDENPYHKPGVDPSGRTCFYIYNDDGSPVTGPTGPKFCYSPEKAAEMVAKAERAGLRVSPSAVSPGPRQAPTGYVRERIQQAAARPITHGYNVGDILSGSRSGWRSNLFKVVAVSPSSVTLHRLEMAPVVQKMRYFDEAYEEMPTGATVGETFRVMLEPDGTFRAMRAERWDGKPVMRYPYMD